MIQFSITSFVECLKRKYSIKTYNKMINKVWKENSDYILHHYGLSKRDDTSFWQEYTNMNMSKTVWKHYKKTGNKYTNLYPDAIWATLGLYYNDFKYYGKT